MIPLGGGGRGGGEEGVRGPEIRHRRVYICLLAMVMRTYLLEKSLELSGAWQS